MSAHELVGWQLLHKLIENDIKSEADVIVAVAHWFLIKEGGFLCLGLGDEKTLAAGEVGTEFLPANWNTAKNDAYSLRYVYNDVIYVLLVTISGETIVLNLLSSASLDVSNIALNINSTVKSLTGPLQTLIPDISSVVARLKIDLLDPIRASVSTTTTTETQTAVSNDRPDETTPPPPLRLFDPDPLLIHPRNNDPLRNIGRGDLDPFGRGGGMLFNPPRPFQPSMPGIPGRPGRHPGIVPGARFDPFSTPDPDRIGRIGPNPDHLPPPNYDDMFM